MKSAYPLLNLRPMRRAGAPGCRAEDTGQEAGGWVSEPGLLPRVLGEFKS